MHASIVRWWRDGHGKYKLDWAMGEALRDAGGRIIATVPSVVQHTGTVGLNSTGAGDYDHADDFISPV